MNTQILVSAKWLALNMSRVKILDASWHMPASNRNAYAEFCKGHISGSQFFDIDKIAADSNTTNLPHMLPTAQFFQSSVTSLGIANSDHVVILSNPGLPSSYRAYWTFKVFGHDHVSILDGGMSEWLKEHGDITDILETPAMLHQYQAKYQPNLVKGYADILGNVYTRNIQVVDARPFQRFAGHAAEPRAGLKSGHIPGSISLPFDQLLQQPNNTLKSVDELQEIFKARNISLDRPIINSCGSGITAAIVAVAAQIAGAKEVSLYDGSWSEYAARKESIIHTHAK